VAKGIEFRVRERASDEVECQVEVCEGEVGEAEGDELVDEFDVEQDFAPERVVRVPDLFEVEEGVDGGEEGAVEPAAALGYEFRDGICTSNISMAS